MPLSGLLAGVREGEDARFAETPTGDLQSYRASGDEQRRLYVNGDLRHIWREDYAGVRSRIGIGVQRLEITIRELVVQQ
jgi:hypothetical protein